jgi:lipopolysaccharide export system protein LptA
MRNRVERLRVWLLGSAIFLMLVIAAFIVSARYLARLHKLVLPAKLGIDVKGDASGYTVSRMVGLKTIFTLHAARWEQHADGKIALHDVSVEIYGKSGDHHDRIYGDEFEYDQNAKVMRALGLVHIDLQAAEAEAAVKGGASKAPRAGANPRVLHVTTRGLVYLEQLGVAATSEYIEFESGGMTGHSIGADYSSDTGVLMLHSAVSMSGTAGKRPVEVTAATAAIDDRSQETLLTRAKYVSPGQTVEAENATLHTRPDGSLSRIEAQGNVTASAKGGTVTSRRADVVLNAAGQAQTAVLTGDVRYSSDMPLHQVRGEADAATIAFDEQASPQPKHAVFTGAVHMTERTRKTAAAGEPWSVRDLTAAKVEAALAPAGPGQSQLRDAEATGNPRLKLTDNGSLASARGEGSTELAADDLKAHLIDTGDAKRPPQLDTVAGRGHTELRQLSVDGTEETSAGDTLEAKFRARVPVAGAKKAGAAVPAGAQQVADEIASAVQDGHVTMMRRVPARSSAVGAGAGTAGAGAGGACADGTGAGEAKPGGQRSAEEEVQLATAERAAYDGDTDRMTLTGSVQLTDAGSVLWTNQIALDHKTCDSWATGAVKVDYVQVSTEKAGAGEAGAANAARGSAARQEPTHVLADRANFVHATEVATFFGQPVRMWQDGSQVQAPVIEVSRKDQRLIARGEASTGGAEAQQAAQVHTVLVNTGSRKAVAPAGKAKAERPEAAKSGAAARGCANATAKPGAGNSGATAQMANVVRVTSGGLVYSGTLNQADFTGGMRAETMDGTIRANEAVVTLQPAKPGQSSATADVPSMAGRLERMVASGAVDIEQPRVRATGERLVYTESDELYVLTGDNSAPPKAVDADGTTTTGAELRFHADDCSVEALGTAPGQPAQRVRTVSRVRDDPNTVKGKP